MKEGAKKYGFEIFDLEVDTIHVHVLASLPLTMSPIDAIGKLKGYTSKLLFCSLPRLRIIYSHGHLWSPGKFIGSLGHITLDKSKTYIEEHHAKILVYFLANPISVTK